MTSRRPRSLSHPRRQFELATGKEELRGASRRWRPGWRSLRASSTATSARPDARDVRSRTRCAADAIGVEEYTGGSTPRPRRCPRAGRSGRELRSARPGRGPRRRRESRGSPAAGSRRSRGRRAAERRRDVGGRNGSAHRRARGRWRPPASESEADGGGRGESSGAARGGATPRRLVASCSDSPTRWTSRGNDSCGAGALTGQRRRPGGGPRARGRGAPGAPRARGRRARTRPSITGCRARDRGLRDQGGARRPPEQPADATVRARPRGSARPRR